jgi:predicted phosphoribosyltransferase
MFRNRSEAGVMLASKLRKYQNCPGIVLAVPRGGIPVACEVAKELGLPLEIVLTKKIGHPFNKEYAIGAASLYDYFVVAGEEITVDYLENELKRIRMRLKEMHEKFMNNKEPESLEGKTVIVIDDGVATGNTLLGTIRVLRKSHPAKIILAVPVASRTAIQKLSPEVEEVVSLIVPDHFAGVSAFYENFEQVNDQEALNLLNRLRQMRKAG